MGESKVINSIHSTLNTYALPSSGACPYSMFYDYFGSSYGLNDNWCMSINCWDAEDADSFFAKEVFTFDFKVRTLISPYQHKYSNLHTYQFHQNLSDLVEGIDVNGITIKIRHDFPSRTLNDFKAGREAPRIKVRGTHGFFEEKLL